MRAGPIFFVAWSNIVQEPGRQKIAIRHRPRCFTTFPAPSPGLCDDCNRKRGKVINRLPACPRMFDCVSAGLSAFPSSCEPNTEPPNLVSLFLSRHRSASFPCDVGGIWIWEGMKNHHHHHHLRPLQYVPVLVVGLVCGSLVFGSL